MWDDLKRIFIGPTLFRLESILSPRLVPILYGAGLLSVLLWAVTHLFATFSRTFGDGLWGLLEIIVYGAFAVVALRVIAEMLLVFFEAHEGTARTVAVDRYSGTLLEEVQDAISDIADNAEFPPPEPPVAPSGLIIPPTVKRPTVRRTAKRTPRTPPEPTV